MPERKTKNQELSFEGLELQPCDPNNDTGLGKEPIWFNGKEYETHMTGNLHRYFSVIGPMNEYVEIPTGYQGRKRELENPSTDHGDLFTDLKQRSKGVFDRLLELTSKQPRLRAAIYSSSGERKTKAMKDLQKWILDEEAQAQSEKEQKILCSMEYDEIVKTIREKGYAIDPTKLCD